MKLRFHKTYAKELCRHLQFNDFCDGSNERVSKYLIKHVTEQGVGRPAAGTNGEPNAKDAARAGAINDVAAKRWAVRLGQLANDNLTEMVLNSYLAQFSRRFTISQIDDLREQEPWESILSDVTGDRQPFKKFYRSLLWEDLLHGFHAVLVEGPDAKADNAAEARASGERSYATIYDITSVPYWEKDASGPNKGRLREIVLFQNPVYKEEEDEPYMKIRRLWIDEDGGNYWSQYFIAKEPGELLEKVDGTFSGIPKEWIGKEFEPYSEAVQGSLPFIPVELFDAGVEESVVKNVVPKNYEYMNKKSVRDSINYYQGFQRSIAFGIDPDNLTMLSECIMALSEDAQGHVDTIEAGKTEALDNDLDRVKQLAVFIGLLRTQEMMSLPTKERLSAESKKLDLNDYEDYLNLLADMLEMALAQIFTFFWWFENGKAPEEPISVTIGRDFNLGAVEGELEETALLQEYSREFGNGGMLYRLRSFIAAVSEKKFAPTNKKEDEAVKSKIIELLEKLAAQIEAAPEESLEELNQQNQPPSIGQDRPDDILAELEAEDAEAA